MNRRAFGLMIGVAITMGLLAMAASRTLGEPLRDPDGFLGPSSIRLPLLVLFAFLIDVVPRSLWRMRRRRGGFMTQARTLVDEHWTFDRMALVVVGLTSFYVTYISYRNLKNYLPRLGGQLRDPMLHKVDQIVAFGHEPAVLLQDVLGHSIAAHVLAIVYEIFLPLAPLSLIVYLVWSRRVSYGCWYATANCLCWALGTASYYAVPSMGPNFYYPWLYQDLDRTSVTSLQDTLWSTRDSIRWNPLADSVQSVAGFASLHCAIILTLTLITHYTVRHSLLRWTMWVYFGLTIVSTLYFGWHYIADDVVGCGIALVAVWLAAVATGQKFDGWGHLSSRPPLSPKVPVAPREVPEIDSPSGSLVRSTE